MSVHFGSFTLDLSSRQLLRGAEVIHLSPKAFQLLAILIEGRPKAIAKSELQQQLWPSTFVAETNLATLIAEVRAALTDDSRKPQFIRTVYGFGYAFSGEACEGSEGTPTAVPTKPKRRLTSLSMLSIVVLSTTMSMKSSHSVPVRAHRTIDSIAILPFKVSSPIAADEYFGAGIADVVTARLSNVREMTVRPTSAVARYGAKGQDPVAAGEQLRVDAILDGTVRRAGNRIRVSVQLFTIRDRRTLWGQTFDANFTEAFKVEDSIAESVASALALKLTHEEFRLLRKRHTDDSEAYRLYVIGQYHLTRLSGTGWKESIPYFEAAIRQDPSYALAYAGLSQAYAKQGIFNDSAPAALWEKAEAAAQRALALDEELSEAHMMMGLVRMQREWNWQVAEDEFKRAIELNASNGLAHRFYAMLLESKGRFDDAIVQRKRALQLDPLSLPVNRELAFTYYLARRYDDAIRQQRLVLELDPNFLQALVGIGQPLVAQDRTDEAIASYRKALSIDGNFVPAKGWLARTEARMGHLQEAQRLLTELQALGRERYVSPYNLAAIHVALGETENAFTHLELAAEQRSTNVLHLAVDPAFDSLHSHERYKALVRRIGLN